MSKKMKKQKQIPIKLKQQVNKEEILVIDSLEGQIRTTNSVNTDLNIGNDVKAYKVIH